MKKTHSMTSSSSSTDLPPLKSRSPSSFSSMNDEKAIRPRIPLACQSCKRRKTKCSGAPDPCTACRKQDLLCQFNEKLDKRRKSSYQLDDLRDIQSFIFESVFRFLAQGSPEQVGKFLALLRTLSITEAGNCLYENVKDLQNRGLLGAVDIDQTEFLSIAGFEKLFESSSTLGKEEMIAQKVDSSLASSTTLNLQKSLLQGAEDVGSGKANAGLPTPSSTLSLRAVNPEDFDFGSTDKSAMTGLVTMDSISLQAEFTFQSQLYDIQYLNDIVAGGPASNMISLPCVFHDDTMGQLCAKFYAAAQEQIRCGTTIFQLRNFGQVDVELLFRERDSSDMWNIPTWACEIVRQLQCPSLSMKLAIVLCMTHFMAFLIQPTQENLTLLPGMIRPTKAQFNFPHHIGISFCPVPAMRTSFIQRYGSSSWDWISIFATYGLSNGWSGKLKEDVNPSMPSNLELMDGLTDLVKVRSMAVDFEPHNAVRTKLDSRIGVRAPQSDLRLIVEGLEQVTSGLERCGSNRHSAIITYSETGRQIVSPEFEKHVFNFSNWSVSRGILQSWPDLSGQIMLRD